MTSVRASDGILTVRFGGGTASFALGTHTAHKFVVPRANRHAHRRTTRQSPSAQQ